MVDPGSTRARGPLDERDPAFLQARMNGLVRVFFVLGWLGLIAHFVVTAMAPSANTPHPRFVDAEFISGCVVTTACLLAMRQPRSLAVLHAIDALFTMFTTLAISALIVIPTGRIDEVYLALFTGAFFNVGRALFVPTSPRRTTTLAVISAVITFSATMYVALGYGDQLSLPRQAFITNSVFCVAAPVLLSTVSARVIARLRAEVREARQVGQYTLQEKIGEGGMGVVYRAQHALLRRPTAIKLLRATASNREAIVRFEREVQRTARLTGPHVVAVFDYGRADDGSFYYAMEYLDGIDLESLVGADGAQPAARVVRLMSQVCDALDEAHQQGLVHRDVKPANIIVSPRGTRSDVVKVVDFGLVMDVTSRAEAAGLSGTPAYLAPEAILHPEAIGPATDLYAVGAVAHFLLTGKPVFEGSNAAEVFEKHLTCEPEPASRRSVHAVPAALDALLLRCLSKDPGGRPASAAELRVAFQSMEEAEGWSEEDSRAWWRTFRERKAAPAAPHARPTKMAIARLQGDAGTTPERAPRTTLG